MVYKPTTSEESVKKATGKNWDQWFKILDKEKAHKLNHTQIAQLVYKIGKKGWWSQMVAVEYERYKGLRKKHETTQGFQVSVSRTIEKSAKDLYAWWVSCKDISITTKHTNKLIRGAWKKGDSRIVVSLEAKAKGKTQVVVQHEKLKNAANVKQMKKFWTDTLEGLK